MLKRGTLAGLLVALSLAATAADKKVPAKARPAKRAATTGQAAPRLTGQVAAIKISGNKKIEADAIRAKIKTKAGEAISADVVSTDVQAIFDMGYFYNIQVDKQNTAQGLELNYIVTEKPSIVEVVYKGNERVDKDDLVEASGVKQYTILDHNKLREAIDKMGKLYEDKGFFLARIQYRIEDVKKGEEVKVTFDIKENDKVRVKKVTFLGNKALPDSKLKAAMQTQEGGFFSWLSGSGSYKQEAFDRDVQVLNYLYFNEGYVQVKIDRPQVYVTPDKRSIYITIRIEEGEQFSVGKVDFAGDLLFSKDELFESTEIQKSGIFVYETLQKDLNTLRFKYGDLGYAFANIIPRTQTRDRERLVDVTFEIEKGQKVYFGGITVTGNSKTRDKVVRRELRIKEGELYNETRKRKSEENVKRLGYFSDVIFNSSTTPEKPDIMNLEIQVKERSTGTIQLSAGYSTVNQFVFGGQVSQSNLFGKGQSLSFSVDLNRNASTYNLGFTEPYFNDTEWSVGFDVYRTSRNLTQYSETKVGGDMRLGHPIAEYVNAYITYKLDNTELSLSSFADPQIYPIDTAKGMTSSVTGSVVYDQRNDRWAPTKGAFSSIALEQAGLGGQKIYTKALANARIYKEMFWKMIFRSNLTYGLLATPKDRQPPFNELFLLGGPYSLRGYSAFTVGTRRRATCCQADPNTGLPIPLAIPVDVPYGGTQQLIYQAEVEFPLISEAQIKGVVFYDIGKADDNLALDNDFRQDVGFGFRWFSPIGPLRFEWGFPIQRRPQLPYNEGYSNFDFSIGSPF